MLDIHCHILPGLDDGAKNINQTIEMLRAAKQAGVTTIIATPHLRGEDLDKALLQSAFSQTEAEAKKLGLQLLLGYEYHSRRILDYEYEEAQSYCLAGTNVLLLEFNMNGLPLQWENTIRNLQAQNLDIIIAHPERYQDIQKDISIAQRMVELGCELQIDAESLTGSSPVKRCARDLLDLGLVSWLASDAHEAGAFALLARANEKFASQLRPSTLLQGVGKIVSLPTGNQKTPPPVRSMPQSKPNKKRALLIALMCIAAVGVLVCGVIIIRNFLRERAERAAYDPDRFVSATPTPEAVEATPEPEETPSPFEGWWYEPYAKIPDREIDFDGLHEINPSIYAWISVEGTQIDYPIVHAPAGDPTYLDHDIYLEKNSQGSIYTDGWNFNDLSDPNTIIYGHNMKNGTMFAQLHSFEDSEFFEQNRIVRIYMPGLMFEYEIFAAYMTDDKHILVLNDFFNEQVYANYLESIYNTRDINAHFRDVGLSTEDRIITLSTCIKGMDTKRYFVQAVLR